MKWQIENQHLRIRIGEDELARLLSGEVVEAKTRFAGAFVMRGALCLAPGDVPMLSGWAHAWRIALPEAAVRAHATRLPSRDGLRYMLCGKHHEQALELLFDVDVRDSARRRHGLAPAS